MCQTWYLSLPVGTIFAFRINARATFQHMHDTDLERELVAEDEKAKLMIGFVRDVSPNGIDFGILTSSSRALVDFTESDSAIRRGIFVYNVPKSSAALSRPRSQTHPQTNPTNVYTGIKALRALDLKYEKTKTFEAQILALSEPESPLRPTHSLPWRTAFAYSPNLGDATNNQSNGPRASISAGALRIPFGARHRFTVGNYSAAGVAARPQPRFSRKEMERAEKMMDKLKKQQNFDREDSNYSTASFESFDLSDDTTKASQARLPIVIDIVLDLESVKNIPQYPDEFERAVERIERIERRAKNRKASTIDE